MKYLYTGPSSGVTLQHDHVSQEIPLYPNTEVELSERDAYTKILIALKHLTPVPLSQLKSAKTRKAMARQVNSTPLND